MEQAYELKEEKSAQGLKFFFISIGKKDIIKVIQYSYVQEFNGRRLYNLEFGDYDLVNDITSDEVNTNNGDVYRVFACVLKTIPIFFENYSQCILMVQGSDSRPGFSQACKLTCSKMCGMKCKNYNRRINIYRKYIDKNFKYLSIDYQFLGGRKNKQHEMLMELYKCKEAYDSVFLYKKSLTL